MEYDGNFCPCSVCAFMTRYDVSVRWLTQSENFGFFLILSTQRYFYEIRDDRFRFRFQVVVHARLRWQPWWRQNG